MHWPWLHQLPVLIGVSELAKKGLLFKEAKFIEALAQTSKVVVDKTGTITNGELNVVRSRVMDKNIHKLNYFILF